MANPLKWTHQEFFVDSHLYEKFDVTDINDKALYDFFYRGSGVDAYCVECKRMSVFRIEEKSIGMSEKSLDRFGVFTLRAKCSRGGQSGNNSCYGEIYFIFYRFADTITKIGQFPSKGDMDFGSLDTTFS